MLAGKLAGLGIDVVEKHDLGVEQMRGVLNGFCAARHGSIALDGTGANSPFVLALVKQADSSIR